MKPDKIVQFPQSEDSVEGTLSWAKNRDFDAVSIVGWKDDKVFFGYSRLNGFIEKLGSIEYMKLKFIEQSKKLDDDE